MMLFHDTLNSPPFPLLWGHVLQPAYDGHAVAIPVAVVCEARAKVFLRIVGQSLSIDSAARYRFLLIDGNATQPFLLLADFDGCAIADGQRIGILLLRSGNDVPYHVVIDDMIRRDAYEPVARLLVAPVGICKSAHSILRLPRHRNKSKQNANDCFLVHFHLFFCTLRFRRSHSSFFVFYLVAKLFNSAVMEKPFA